MIGMHEAEGHLVALQQLVDYQNMALNLGYEDVIAFKAKLRGNDRNEDEIRKDMKQFVKNTSNVIQML